MLDDPDRLFDTPGGGADDEIALELASLFVETGAIKFGKFPLKHGRASPYILDVNYLSKGHLGLNIGRPYAKTVEAAFGPNVTIFYAASLRALPFAVMAAWYYGSGINTDVAWACPSGPAGPVNTPSTIMGTTPTPESHVVIIDDIFTSGLAVREAISRLKSIGATVAGVCSLVDRKERSKHGRWMSEEITRDTGVKVTTCVAIHDLIRHIPESALPAERRATIVSYSTQLTIEPAKPRDSKTPD